MDELNVTDEKREPLLQHMSALGRAIRNTIFWIFLGAGLGYIFSGEILSWMTEPYSKVLGGDESLVYISPFEKIWVHLRVAMWAGVFLVLPGIYYSFYGFFKPALLKSERKGLHFFCFLTFIVCIIGAYLGQQFVVPLLLKALVNFKDAGEIATISLGAFINMALGVIIATALLLELPLLMFQLSFMGWVTPQNWREGRRVAIVVNSAVSAFLSPPDVLSMVILMLPIQILYECGILASRMAEWKGHVTQES